MKEFFYLRLLPNKFPALHGLRALGIFLIVIYHVYPQYPLGLVNLWFVMDLVFVLSGFLIGLILLNDLSKGEGGLIRFYVRRSIRIFPAYYVVLLSAAYFFGLPEETRKVFWKELLYLTNYNYETDKYLMPWSWSLSLDEHFYLICPILIMTLRKWLTVPKQLRVLFVLWFSCLIVRLGYLLTAKDYTKEGFINVIYYPTHTRYDTLIAGLALAYAIFYFPDFIIRIMKKPIVQIGTLALSIAIFSFFLTMPYLTDKDTFGQALMFTFCFGTLSSIAYVSLFLHVIYVNSRLTRFLGKYVFLQMATLSYGFYLVHLFVLRYFSRPMLMYWVNWNYDYFKTFLGWATLCSTTIISSFFFAYLVHLLVEKPALWLRETYFR